MGAGGSSGGVGATLKDGNPPTVEAVGLTVDGNALAVGPGIGEATVKVDGKRYTITGTAQGGSMSNPMAGVVKKPFEIAVTCS
ncbi:lipoprotein LpqH [Tsukamurella spumae]|uniref:lipoprotein LpqH n=1 Tax=Tsukamurella spumae TaxID=44753 RepID=UPI0031CEA61C